MRASEEGPVLSGRIPVFERWMERLSSGKIGMDALTNTSRRSSFATDQEVLGNRVKSLL